MSLASGRNINGVHLFQVLPRTEVTQLLARIGNPVFSTQVTLFANAIASSGGSLAGLMTEPGKGART